MTSTDALLVSGGAQIRRSLAPLRRHLGGADRDPPETGVRCHRLRGRGRRSGLAREHPAARAAGREHRLVRPRALLRTSHCGTGRGAAERSADPAGYSTLTAFPEWPLWQEIAGGGWTYGTTYHPAYGPAVALAKPEHPLTAGLDRLAIVDERYTKLWVDDQAGVFLEHEEGGATSPAGLDPGLGPIPDCG